MYKGINFNKCKKILSEDINKENDIEKLQKYIVDLRDAYNLCNRFDELKLTQEALKREFIVKVEGEAASGYIPKDPFMSVNIPKVIRDIESRLNELYTHSEELLKKIQFLDNLQRNEEDLLVAKDLIKKDYEKNETMTFEELGRNISVDIANIMLECGYGSKVFFKCKNLEDYKKEAKDILVNDRDIDDVAKSIGTSYDELIKRIDNAAENKENIEMFKINDFYCEFSREQKDKDILNVYYI